MFHFSLQVLLLMHSSGVKRVTGLGNPDKMRRRTVLVSSRSQAKTPEPQTHGDAAVTELESEPSEGSCGDLDPIAIAITVMFYCREGQIGLYTECRATETLALGLLWPG
jgi:hypothetical protein